MQTELAAARLAELGHTTRLTIFRLLVKAGQTGISVGEIQQQLDIPGSTLSHHLARMIKVDLVEQQRDGRTLYCRLRFAEVEALLSFLYDECCSADGKPGWLVGTADGCDKDAC